jgi:hypothetical protein
MLGWKVVRRAKGSVRAVWPARLRATPQERLRPPAGWHTAPPGHATTSLLLKELCLRRAVCQAPEKLARWQAGGPLGPDTKRPGDTHQPPKGATGPTRPQQSPQGCLTLATRQLEADNIRAALMAANGQVSGSGGAAQLPPGMEQRTDVEKSLSSQTFRSAEATKVD